MIDPQDITKFDRTDDELLEFWLFCLLVAGKTAKTQARALQSFMDDLPSANPGLPNTLRWRIGAAIQNPGLTYLMSKHRFGQYRRLHTAITQTLGFTLPWREPLDLRTCAIEDLEGITGVGPKTARFFLMHTRPGQRFAALDTHILKLLREEGVEKVPTVTPGSPRQYRRLEDEFLRLADASGMSVAEFDLSTWKRFSKA